MIDVRAASDRLPPEPDRRIGEALTRVVLRAKGVSAPGPFHRENTAAFIRRMDPPTVQTAARAVARVIRVQGITPTALSRGRQKQLVQYVTAIQADICDDPSPAKRRWVSSTEAAEGGWGNRGYGVRSRGVRARGAAAAAAKK
jgi:hypothetical protein